mgnify:FL=1
MNQESIDTSNLIPAAEIARLIKRSKWGVIKAIRRLELEPDLEIGGVRYYHKDKSETIKDSMRKENKA